MYNDSREDYFARREEEREMIRDRWRLTAGVTEFVGVIAGGAAILLLVLLIVSLSSWLLADLRRTFSVFIALFSK